MRALLLAAPLFLAACKSKEEASTVWQQFNADDDVVVVEVGVPESEGEPVELRSNTGAVVIGTVTVDPASGPVGTVHEIRVVLDEAYGKKVEYAQVLADSGERGTWTLDLVQDRARKNIWSLKVQSYGAEDERRTDTFTFLLWERVPAPAGQPE